MAEDRSAAQGRRSTAWAFLLLLRLVVCLPIYAWGVLMALLAGSTARGILRVERTLWAWTDTIYRWAGVETGRKWLDAR